MASFAAHYENAGVLARHTRFKCYEGRILKIGEQSMTFKLLDLTTITIDRSDVLRFGGRGCTTYGVQWPKLLAGRDGNSSQYETAHTSSNEERQDARRKKVSFTDSGITLLERGKLVVIAKNEISKVYFG